MSQNKQETDSVGNKEHQSSRRGLLKKTAIGAPVLMTLINRPAYGAICTISGFQSVNPSGVTNTKTNCGGFSPGGWKHPDNGQGGTDGNRQQWYAAGFNPNPRAGLNDPSATLFKDAIAFGMNPPTYMDPNITMNDVMLNHHNSLENHAVANLLNANYFVGYGISAADVVGLYQAFSLKLDSYTTSSGTTVDISTMTESSLKSFFDQYRV